MIILDTNVISELMRQPSDAGVVSWADQYPPEELFLTAVTVAELCYGVERLPDGRRKHVLAGKIADLLAEDFCDRILPFDGEVAVHYGRIVASLIAEGRSISMADAQVAAICRQHDASLATRNVKDFAGCGIEVVNPWDSGFSTGRS